MVFGGIHNSMDDNKGGSVVGDGIAERHDLVVVGREVDALDVEVVVLRLVGMVAVVVVAAVVMEVVAVEPVVLLEV